MSFRATSLTIDTQQATVGGYRLLSNDQVINGDSVPLVPGMAVTIIGNDTVVRASSASTALAAVDGFVWAGNDVTLMVMMRSFGRLDLSTSDWDAVTGGTGGLTPGLPYFLDTVLGGITSTAPEAEGLSVVRLGKALTPTSFLVDIEDPVLL